jgi:hypothetical protein
MSLLPPLADPGLDQGSPLRVASFGDLAAIYCAVSLQESCGPEAASHRGDLAWMGPWARRHREVVESVMRHSPVLPARLGTLFGSREKLEQVLRVHYDTVARFLEEVTDQQEWAVKGLLTRARALEAHLTDRLAREADRLAALPPGRRYQEEQRLRVEAEQELSRWLRQVCRELAGELNDFALHRRDGRLTHRDGNGSGQEMVFNWAFLVPQAAAAGFGARIEAANRRHSPTGLVFELTGPGPPYSFSPALNLEPEP